jgi:hypothetical protein
MTDPTAAPTTVPSAPNADPTTAAVTAAPAPAITLLTVRPGFAAGAGGGFDGRPRDGELIAAALSGGLQSSVSTHR